MSRLIDENRWVWVLIQSKNGQEEIVGQHYEGEDISFIPAFLNKDDAMMSYNNFTLAPDSKAEVQAIRYKGLTAQASQNGFLIFILNGKGEILDKVSP
jgi:dolichyl-phosphate-mannose--protein O-mannosyl transferase